MYSRSQPRLQRSAAAARHGGPHPGAGPSADAEPPEHYEEYEAQYTSHKTQRRKIYHDARLRYYPASRRFVVRALREGVNGGGSVAGLAVGSGQHLGDLNPRSPWLPDGLELEVEKALVLVDTFLGVVDPGGPGTDSGAPASPGPLAESPGADADPGPVARGPPVPVARGAPAWRPPVPVRPVGPTAAAVLAEPADGAGDAPAAVAPAPRPRAIGLRRRPAGSRPLLQQVAPPARDQEPAPGPGPAPEPAPAAGRPPRLEFRSVGQMLGSGSAGREQPEAQPAEAAPADPATPGEAAAEDDALEMLLLGAYGRAPGAPAPRAGPLARAPGQDADVSAFLMAGYGVGASEHGGAAAGPPSVSLAAGPPAAPGPASRAALSVMDLFAEDSTSNMAAGGDAEPVVSLEAILRALQDGPGESPPTPEGTPPAAGGGSPRSAPGARGPPAEPVSMPVDVPPGPGRRPRPRPHPQPAEDEGAASPPDGSPPVAKVPRWGPGARPSRDPVLGPAALGMLELVLPVPEPVPTGRAVALPARFPTPGAYAAGFSLGVAELLQLEIHRVAGFMQGVARGLAAGRREGPAPPARQAASGWEFSLRKHQVAAHALCWLDTKKSPFRKGADEQLYTLTLGKGRLPSSSYAKEDIWGLCSFHDLLRVFAPPAGSPPGSSPSPGPASVRFLLAQSTFFGPDSSGGIEMAPITQDPAGWRALLATSRSLASNKGTLSPGLFGIRLVNASSEVSMLESLELVAAAHASADRRSPIFQVPCPLPSSPDPGGDIGCYFRRVRPSATWRPGEALLAAIGRLREDTIAEYALNDDQAAVLGRLCGATFGRCPPVREPPPAGAPAGGPSPDVTLVHGVFGAGKSRLLAVAIVFLHRAGALLREHGARLGGGRGPGFPAPRLALCALTNTAVDSVLQALLRLGFEHFCRLGPVPKVAPPVLPFLAGARPSAHDDEIRDLQELLRDPQHPGREWLRRALDRLRTHRARDLVLEAFLVATTVASCATSRTLADVFPVPGDARPESAKADARGSGDPAPAVDLLLIDECSQLLEPASLVALTRFRPGHLVLVGDPLQLAPTLTSPFAPGRADGRLASRLPAEPGPTAGLERTLFERLRDVGAPVAGLLTQYRCHPAIVRLCNELFYGGRIATAPEVAGRGPVLASLPPVSLVRVPPGYSAAVQLGTLPGPVRSFLGQMAAGVGGGAPAGAGGGPGGRSLSHPGEAQVLFAAVYRLVAVHGVDPARIGVICLYRAQARLVQGLLEQAQARLGLFDRAAEPGDGGSGRPGPGLPHVSTVDAFQGAERDIILLSCVKAATSRPGQVDEFVEAPRRINVALSRARCHLVIVAQDTLVVPGPRPAGTKLGLWPHIAQLLGSDPHGSRVLPAAELDSIIGQGPTGGPVPSPAPGPGPELDVDPADLDPVDFEPGQIDPADLDPADFDPVDLDPADFELQHIDPADFDQAFDLGPGLGPGRDPCEFDLTSPGPGARAPSGGGGAGAERGPVATSHTAPGQDWAPDAGPSPGAASAA
ncbi:hypothetical protein H696_01899 [Fonticula alba]|uniref:DNA2/NAM7 helicase-like C-terminal domain-containing protein n=1 Tax=Fonticula alba TaxID=691883 RepID=A0A058ZBZ9_FONAL|nr:hypothetical protein H696_01899 [Fonticula alba]KCV70952.1 hypothetical protein H696_01899 [Fonticula alba]|eukprot:XP_009494075.1 hypothetical protein H696_01899 [Fonticula alba]